MLYSIDSTPAVMRGMMGGGQDTAESMMKEYLEEAGFSVTVFTPEEEWKTAPGRYAGESVCQPV